MAAASVPSNASARVVALDNLRVVAMLLGLVTHGVLPYTATGVAQFPIRDCTRHPAADAAYFAVHDFRMQLFFLLAGFAGTALATRRGAGALARNRLTRVALPLLLAVLFICPAMHLLFAHHTASRGLGWEPAESGGWVGPNFHLWFLFYLLMCCVPLAIVLVAGPRLPGRIRDGLDHTVTWFVGRWWAIPALATAAIPILWDMPAWWIDTPKGWLPDLTIYIYYLGFFLTGALLYRHRDLLPGIGRRWPIQLAVANVIILPLMLKLTITGNWAEESAGGLPAWLVGWKAGAIFLGGLYTWLMLAALLGIFLRYFAGSARWWRYLADASYWCYLAGFPIQAALQVWFAHRDLPIILEFLIVNALTFTALLVSYELCVRHSWVGLMLNGKRPERRQVTQAEPEPAIVLATRVSVAAPEATPAPNRPPLPAPAAGPDRRSQRKHPRSDEHAPLPVR
jgi:peptidoglycan/LPS O-acetylase OafA/YrhL